MTDTPMPIVKTYEDGLTLRMRLWSPDNDCVVAFEIWEDDEDLEVEGSVKWDGCMNWQTNPRCMYHFCGPEDADRINAVLKDVWIEGKKLMPGAIY